MEKHFNLRVVLVILALIIGIGAITYGVSSCLNSEPGWQEIEAESSELNCSVDFTFQYCLGQSDMSATAEKKQLTALYTQLVEKGYQIFAADESFDGVNNVSYVNVHVNEEITVDPGLYHALVLADQYDFRYLFLAPVWQEYEAVFLCTTDAEAVRYDPTRSEETKAYFAEICTFINDPSMIDLQILGDNRIRLNVARDYLDFAEENGITDFLDFGWMVNAFIADYMADSLAEHGFTNGYLASYDGFTRNLDQRGETYGLNIFDLVGKDIYRPATIRYTGPAAMVNLRSYPMVDADKWHYYGFEDGAVLSLQADKADGLYRSSLNDLLSYSYDTGCAEILMQILPIYIAQELDAEGLNSLSGTGIYSVWCSNGVVCYNDAKLTVELYSDSGGASYKKKLIDSVK